MNNDYQWFLAAAEAKINQLEEEMTHVKDVAKRYRDVYVNSNKGSAPESLCGTESGHVKSEADDRSKKIMTEELDDDEALFKRHVVRLAETKSMKTTAPIRVQDIIRKNDVS